MVIPALTALLASTKYIFVISAVEGFGDFTPLVYLSMMLKLTLDIFKV
jgi:hypothetical protein